MKVLYVTGVWNGFDDTIFNAAVPGSGLPAFWEPLSYMLDRGFDIHFVTIEGKTIERAINSGDPRIEPDRFMARVPYQGRLLGRLKSVYRLKKAVRRLLMLNDYDFVYLHGPTAGVCGEVVSKCGVPFGQRLYGTFLWQDLNRYGKAMCRFLRRNEFLSFVEQKEFLLVTNDGSGGDLVHNRISSDPSAYKFFYWINGVNRPTAKELAGFDNVAVSSTLSPFNYIFYCARFDDWKRQDRALKVLSLVLDNTNCDLKLVFAGDTRGDYADYFNEIRALAAVLGVEDRLIFLGHIARSDILTLHHHALASLFLFDVCNLTNALHEAVAAGGAVIVLKDQTMLDYIVEGENGFLCEDINDAAAIVSRLLASPKLRSDLCVSARLWSSKNLLTWEERVIKEVQLIEACVRRATLSEEKGEIYEQR